MTNVHYDDGIYSVSQAIMATPTRFYPLANTTASIRRDPLWAATAFTVFGLAAFLVYGDLLHVHEQGLLAAICAAGIVGGREFCILRLDAVGHRRTMIVGRKRRIVRLYQAIRDARTENVPVLTLHGETAGSRDENF